MTALVTIDRAGVLRRYVKGNVGRAVQTHQARAKVFDHEEARDFCLWPPAGRAFRLKPDPADDQYAAQLKLG